MVESGISVAVDVERLGECIAEQVAHRLAGLFPSEATDFWVTLVEQADDNDDGDPPPTPLDPDPGDEPAGRWDGDEQISVYRGEFWDLSPLVRPGRVLAWAAIADRPALGAWPLAPLATRATPA